MKTLNKALIIAVAGLSLMMGGCSSKGGSIFPSTDDRVVHDKEYFPNGDVKSEKTTASGRGTNSIRINNRNSRTETHSSSDRKANADSAMKNACAKYIGKTTIPDVCEPYVK
ncbi:MAG: hypothetical protein ACI9TY_000867 [Alphaproteobacteria bacterium]|jgi:hypothetical protein